LLLVGEGTEFAESSSYTSRNPRNSRSHHIHKKHANSGRGETMNEKWWKDKRFFWNDKTFSLFMFLMTYAWFMVVIFIFENVLPFVWVLVVFYPCWGIWFLLKWVYEKKIRRSYFHAFFHELAKTARKVIKG
jgi:hypothetical protein